MKRKNPQKRVLLFAGAIYLFFWFTTAIVGPLCIDQQFDREHSQGLSWGSETAVPVERIPFIPIRNANSFPPELNGFYRCRSHGFPIAPFIIIDEASWMDGSLSGYSGFRVNLCLFFYSWSFPLKTWWVS